MVTLSTIAKESGYSLSTTAKILNTDNEAKFAESTRRKVLETAKRLNYRPNAAARSMRNRRTNCIALLVRFGNRAEFPGNASAIGYIHGIQEALAEKDMHLVLVTIDEFEYGGEIHMPLVFREAMVEGLIVEYGLPPAIEEAILNSREPVVWLNTPRQMGEDCILPDERFNVTESVRYLLETGYENIVYVGNIESTTHFSSKLRHEVYCEAMRANGLEPQVLAISNALTGEAVGAVMRKHLPQFPSGTVLLCYDTMYATEVNQAASQAGVCIPSDVSLFTLDLNKMLLGRWTFLAGLNFDRRAMGKNAVKMLLEKIENGNAPVPSVGFKGMIETGSSLRR